MLPVFLPREDSNPSRCTQKHFILPCVLVCHGEVHEMWNKSHLPTLSSCDSPWQPWCCSASVSAALGSLLKTTTWGGTWVTRGAPLCPGRTTDVLPCPEIPSHPTNAQPVVHSPPEKGWWITLLVWLWCPFLGRWCGCPHRAMWRQWPGCAHAPPEGLWAAPATAAPSIHSSLGLQGARELALCC